MRFAGRSCTAVVLKVMPDDAQAIALRRRQAALNYTPQNGFHKDRRQDRIVAASYGLPR